MSSATNHEEDQGSLSKVSQASEEAPSQSEPKDEKSSGLTKNAVAGLRKGHINVPQGREKFTVLLVGETGVGKTSVLSLLANILAGRRPDEYKDMYDRSNEEGGPSSQSQTNSAKIYEFATQNDVTMRVLDTPGLADTRGIGQDEHHRASIAQAIKEHVDIVDAIIILSNGTNPRLGIATDYALTTLSSIFPRSIVENIAILFTCVADRLMWNFDKKSLPPALRNCQHYILNNPVALQAKHREMLPDLSEEEEEEDRDKIKIAENAALRMLVNLFDWLNEREPQPTMDILSLYEQSQEIEKNIQNTIARMRQAKDKKSELEKLKADVAKANLHVDILKNYEKIMKRKYHKHVDKTYHSTLCCKPDCYRNCHEHCQLSFSLGPVSWRCKAMSLFGGCTVCGHDRDKHRHYNSLWEEVEEDERIVDEGAKEKYDNARNDVDKKKAMQDIVQVGIDKLTKDIDDSIAKLGTLSERYAGLSLSGSFSSQVEKSISLLKLHIETMRMDASSSEIIRRMEGTMKNLEEKLDVLRKANANARQRSNLDTLK